MNRKKIKQLQIISGLLIIVLIAELIYVGYHVWVQEVRSIYFEGINSVVPMDSSYVTVGSNNDNSLHYEKGKITIYDAKRQRTFEKLYNVGYNSVFFGVAIDKNQDIVVVGSYEKTEEEHNESVRRALIVKYDKKGNILFEKDFRQLDNSKFTSVLCVDDGYLVVGQSIYKNTKVGYKDGGAILAKFDKDGMLLWSQSFGSSKNAIFHDLVVVDNYIYVVGVDSNGVGVIAKYDLEGNYITYNHYEYTDDLGFSGLIVIDQTIYVCGALKNDSHDTDALIVQYDLDCNYVGEVSYLEEGIARFNKIIVDDQNQLVAIGNVAKVTKNNSISSYNHNGFIAKYDMSLKIVDSVSYGDEKDDFFTDVIFDQDYYLVVGYSSYEDGSYMSKFIRYSMALKVLGVES